MRAPSMWQDAGSKEHPLNATHPSADAFRVSNAEDVCPRDVHKLLAENVWVAAPRLESTHTLSASYQVPPGKRALRFVDLMEVQRQVGMLQLHRQLDLPRSDVLVLNGIQLRFVADAPDSASLAAGIVHSSQVQKQSPASRTIDQYFSIESNSGLAAVGRSRVTTLPQLVYDRIRRTTTTKQTATEARAERATEDVQLTVDPFDPLNADHPSDHITAMQIAGGVESALLGSQPSASMESLKLTFNTYVELAPSAFISIARSRTAKFRGRITQNGLVRASFAARVNVSTDWSDHAVQR